MILAVRLRLWRLVNIKKMGRGKIIRWETLKINK